ncbi:MAG: PAS domain-containing protein [Sphingomicrobium sp.]
MYEAPDRYKRMVAARLPGGESLGLTSQETPDSGSPLRDIQLISRGQLAPFFALANIVAMLCAVVALWRVAPLPYLGGWAIIVVGANLFATRVACNQAITNVGRSGRKVPQWQLVGDVAARALLWLSLPVLLFPGLDGPTQIILATLTAALGTAALGLVVIPACATTWLTLFVVGLSGELLVGRHTVPFVQMLATLFTLGVAVFGVLAIARWAFHQLKINADIGSQSESASLLLQEYEQRGVGWLWQVDSDNRVTYISSRMTALLGRPSSQILGHSLPSLLGGHAELGRVLLEKKTFTSLEMELATARGTRWISIAGDPIIDTAGRFE